MQTSYLKSVNRFPCLRIRDEIRKPGPPWLSPYQIPGDQTRHLRYSPERGLSFPPYIPRGKNVLAKAEYLEHCRSGLADLEALQACLLLLAPRNRAERQHSATRAAEIRYHARSPQF